MRPLLAILFTVLCLAGNAQFTKFKCYQTASFNSDEYAKDITESRFSNVNLLVTIDLHEHQVKTYGQTDGEYTLIHILNSDTQGNGDMHVTYQAIDEHGDKCKLIISSFADKSHVNVATIVIRYSFTGLIFRLAQYN